MQYIVIAMLAILFSSCSAGWHLHRAIKKDPGMFDTTAVVRVDTVQLPPLEKVITKIQLIPGEDTTIVRSEHGVTIRIIRRGDFAFVECECPPSQLITKTIEKIVHIKVPPTNKDKWKIWWRKTRWMLLVAIGLFVGWKLKSFIPIPL